jgi:4-amino-4-deoxy-L-arabinose transferase-like glycosyltransferase
MVEFPLYQSVAFGLSALAPSVPIEMWLRLVTIFCSVATFVLVGLLVSFYADKVTGLVAMAWGAVLPYNIYYGRSILPDPSMVFLSVASLWAIHIYSTNKGRERWIWLVVGGCLSALALLVKPMAGFLLLPVVYLFLRNIKWHWQWVLGGVVYAVLSLVPFLWWRSWITNFPEGIPVYLWLFNEGNIRFKGAWFYWLFARRLGELILGYWGTVLVILGMVTKPQKGEGAFFRWWLLGALAYFIVIARGNVQHDYYQILVIPVVIIYLAKGCVFLWRSHDQFGFWGKGGMLVTSLFLLSFSWYTIRTYYWVNKAEIVEAGKFADSVLPKDAKVIAPYSGDTTFLYQTNRQG